MKLESDTKAAFIELSRNSENDWPSFRIAAAMALGHSYFAAENADIALLNPADFLRQLDAFILDRSIRPRLEATYDTWIEMTGKGRRISVRFCVGSLSGFEPVTLQGMFEIEESSLMTVLAQAIPLHT